MELDPCPTRYMKINSKWIKTLNIRPKTIKLEENIERKLQDIKFGNFLVMTTKARGTEAKRDK